MKKKLLSIALLAAAAANAQTILWNQDFTSATPPGLPAGWMQNNVDGLTPVSGASSYSFGTNAWVTRDMSSFAAFAGHGKVAASISYYTPSGTANDWLITPQFSVSPNTHVKWDAMASNGSYPDGYQVLVSTTGTTVASFTNTLLTVAAENTSWTTRAVSLNTFSGQSVYVAIRNNSNDMELLFVDNISAIVPAANDGAVTTLTSTPVYMAPGGTVSVSGSFKNNGGAAVNTAAMSYRLDNNAVVNQTMNFSALGFLQSAAYSFTTPTGALAAGTHTLKAWVNSVNGVTETNRTNDTAVAIIHVATQSRPRNALIEEFSSSTCGPCAGLNVTFDPLMNTNNPNTGGQVNVIKYQMNWPGAGNDPSYNQHGNVRRGFYDVQGIPYAITNGVTEMQAHNQAEINAAKAEPAWVDMSSSISVVGNNIVGSTTVTPYVTTSGNRVRLFQVFAQKYYNYPGAATSQKDYYHAMRVMNPNGAGSLANLTVGTPVNASFNHTAVTVATPAQNSFDFWINSPAVAYEYIAFVQDTVSHDVLNSSSAVYNTVGLVNLEKDSKIGVYPNPASNAATIAVKLEETASVEISVVDVTGKVVYAKEKETLGLGQNEITINTESFKQGTYIVIVKTNEKVLNTKLTIVK